MNTNFNKWHLASFWTDTDLQTLVYIGPFFKKKKISFVWRFADSWKIGHIFFTVYPTNLMIVRDFNEFFFPWMNKDTGYNYQEVEQQDPVGADEEQEGGTVTRDDSKSPGRVCQSGLVGVGGAGHPRVIRPFPPLHSIMDGDTASPPSGEGGYFCPTLLHPTAEASFSHTHTLAGIRPQLTLWHSCCGTEPTPPHGPGSRSCGKLKLSQQQQQQHKAERLPPDHDGSRSRGRQGPWYWAVCQGGECQRELEAWRRNWHPISFLTSNRLHGHFLFCQLCVISVF